MKYKDLDHIGRTLTHLSQELVAVGQALNRPIGASLTTVANTVSNYMDEMVKNVIDGNTPRLRAAKDAMFLFADYHTPRLENERSGQNIRAVPDFSGIDLKLVYHSKPYGNDTQDPCYRVPFFQCLGLLFATRALEGDDVVFFHNVVRSESNEIVSMDFTLKETPQLLAILGEKDYVTITFRMFVNTGAIGVVTFSCPSEGLDSITARVSNEVGLHATARVYEEVLLPLFYRYFNPNLEVDFQDWKQQLENEVTEEQDLRYNVCIKRQDDGLIDSVRPTTLELRRPYDSPTDPIKATLEHRRPFYRHVPNKDYLSWLVAYAIWKNRESFGENVVLLYDEESKSVAIEPGDQHESTDPLAEVLPQCSS